MSMMEWIKGNWFTSDDDDDPVFGIGELADPGCSEDEEEDD